MIKKKLVVAGLFFLVLVVAVQTIAAQGLVIPSQYGNLQLPGILHKPDGEGPFPAVVMLCGCLGYTSEPDATQQSTWADRLVSWGYVALQVDSFTPRGNPNGICGRRLPPGDRVLDAFSAKSYLSTLSYVDPNNIAVMGWSHGGWAVMNIIDAHNRDKKASPFKTAVAFYPPCYPMSAPDTPVLVLIGKKDDNCPASWAEARKEDYRVRNWKPEFSLTVYPNATHAFDFETLPAGGVTTPGHHVEYDRQATSDAIARTRDFLAKYLGAK